MSDVDRCICCGNPVPEGQMVCEECKIKPLRKTNGNYFEIHRLTEYLYEDRIPFEEGPAYDGWQVCIPSFEDVKISVIEHMFSYGSMFDMLEMMDASKEGVKGMMSAVDVSEYVNRLWEKKGYVYEPKQQSRKFFRKKNQRKLKRKLKRKFKH